MSEQPTAALSVDEQQVLGRLQSRLFGEVSEPLRVSRYVLLERLGAGGAGVVYAAYDPELDRKVAVKLLHVASDGVGGDVEAWIQREAQTVAKLAHPNVVAVYDVGTYDLGSSVATASVDPRAGEEPHARGVFVVMELVAGPTLREWNTSSARSVPEILEVFEQAGRGLAAAHHADLVHRDFKPANVIVGDDGRARVLDFGIARMAGERAEMPAQVGTGNTDAALVQTDTITGTPTYMSPEQHQGHTLDARSDQFSFCVALFESLYGQRPFDGVDMDGLRTAKVNGRVVSSTRSEVPGRVGRAIRRGLAADPSARFDSMDALLNELIAHRRSRRVARVVALVGLAVGAGVWAGAQVDDPASACAAATVRRQLAGVWDAPARARLDAAFARSARTWAPRSARRVGETLDVWAERWVEARSRSCRSTVAGDADERVAACLDRGRAQAAEMLAVLEVGDDSALERSVDAAGRLPDPASCEGQRAPPPTPRTREVSAKVERLLARAVISSRLGKLDAAGAAAEDALTLAEREDDRALMSRSLRQRCVVKIDRGKADDAVRDCRLAWAQAEVVGDSVAGYEAMLSSAEAFLSMGKLSDAAGALQIARARADWLGLGDRERAALRTVDASFAALDGRHEEAAQLLDLVLKDLDPQRPLAIMARGRRGQAALAMGDVEGARGHLNTALDVVTAVYGEDHPSVLTTLNALGALAMGEQRFDEAKAVYGRAILLARSAYGARSPMVAVMLGNRGNVHTLSGDYEAARDDIEAALDIARSEQGKSHPNTARQADNLGFVLNRLGDHEAALAIQTEALAARRGALDPEHADLGFSFGNLGVTTLQLGRWEDARSWFAKAGEVWGRVYGADAPENYEVWWGLGVVALETGDRSAAVALLRRAESAIAGGAAGPVELALCRFALARATFEDDPRGAHALADQAWPGYAGLQMARDSESAIEAWRASHPAPP